jgi:GntR family transcriptional regulator
MSANARERPPWGESAPRRETGRSSGLAHAYFPGKMVGSRPATSPESGRLGCSPGQCVTVIERTHYDADDRPVETSDIVVRADRWRLEYDIAFSAQDSEASA